MNNFSNPVDRRGSGSYKWDAMKREFGVSAPITGDICAEGEALPMWVADMDFETPTFIVEALRKRIEHPIFGYSLDGEDYWPTISKWIGDHHGWYPETEWMCYVPGIVKGIGFAVNCLTQPGDSIVVQQPVYHPFANITRGNGRNVVNNALIEREDGLYDMDLDGLERILDCDNTVRMLILCNPHNPGGVVWSRECLVRLADICHSHNVIVVSDEIHCDLVLWGNKHIPFASVSDKAREISIIFGAPSKTFNIAGIVSSYAIVPNKELRNRFFSWLEASEFSETHLFAVVATKAAYKEGEPWRKELIEYIERNVTFFIDYCREHIPYIRAIRPEASYLLWMDCREMEVYKQGGQEALVDFFLHDARLALNDGAMFGPGGEGHMRINLACPRSRVEAALKALTPTNSPQGGEH